MGKSEKILEAARCMVRERLYKKLQTMLKCQIKYTECEREKKQNFYDYHQASKRNIDHLCIYI